MFPLAALLFLATIPVVLMLHETPPHPSQAHLAWSTMSCDRRIRTLIEATFLLGLALSIVGTFVGVYLNRVSGSRELVGLFAAATAVSQLPSMHWSQRILQRWGGPQTLLWSYALLGSSYAGLVWIDQPMGLLLVGGGARVRFWSVSAHQHSLGYRLGSSPMVGHLSGHPMRFYLRPSSLNRRAVGWPTL